MDEQGDSNAGHSSYKIISGPTEDSNYYITAAEPTSLVIQRQICTFLLFYYIFTVFPTCKLNQ